MKKLFIALLLGQLTYLSINLAMPLNLPDEIWWEIGKFLEGDDPAIKFIAQMVPLTFNQAEILIFKYLKTNKMDILNFYSNLDNIKKALLKKMSSPIKKEMYSIISAMLFNDSSYLDLKLKSFVSNLIS